MEIVLFLAPFVLIGVAVLFIAFSGGPSQAREAYLTRGNRGFKIVIPLVYLGLGIAVPAFIIAAREEARGGTDALKTEELGAGAERGKSLFIATCASCHDLDAVNARGVTGPDLDEVGEMTTERVLGAIRNGGTGQKRMPTARMPPSIQPKPAIQRAWGNRVWGESAVRP
jgi:mono/diheme cytochrome c family protein